MFAEHLEAAVIGADHATLDDIARNCWRALAAGTITECDAQGISEAVETRRLALAAA